MSRSRSPHSRGDGERRPALRRTEPERRVSFADQRKADEQGEAVSDEVALLVSRAQEEARGAAPHGDRSPSEQGASTLSPRKSSWWKGKGKPKGKGKEKGKDKSKKGGKGKSKQESKGPSPSSTEKKIVLTPRK